MAGSGISLQLSVSELGATEAFYAGILGLEVDRAPTPLGVPEQLVVRCDGCELIFFEDEALGRAHPILQARLEAFPRGVGVTLHLKVDGIQEIYEELLDQELEVLYPLEWKPYGIMEVWCFDPDGYLIVLEEPST